MHVLPTEVEAVRGPIRVPAEVSGIQRRFAAGLLLLLGYSITRPFLSNLTLDTGCETQSEIINASNTRDALCLGHLGPNNLAFFWLDLRTLTFGFLYAL